MTIDQNRRKVILGTVATVAAAGVGLDLSNRQAGAQTLFPRSDAHSPEGQQALNRYRAAVSVMKNRPGLDPTSWTYQALIHGIVTEAPRDSFIQAVFANSPIDSPARLLAEDCWATCPHSGLAFLAWHRLYLYFFERIARVASGDPDFSLPYWDYSLSDINAVLPAEMRESIDGSPLNNALFSLARSPEINGLFGNAVPIGSTDVSLHALREPFFESTEDRPGLSAALENTPHNLIHGAVGGGDSIGTPLGDMSSTATAGRDPVFWIHHANIDRLWESWLSSSGETMADYADRDWYTRRWTFIDETGGRRNVSLADMEPELVNGQVAYDRLEKIQRDAVPAIAVASSVLSLSSTSEGPITLTQEGQRVEFQMPVIAAVGDVRSARVVLNEVVSETELAVTFDVFLNIPVSSSSENAMPIGAFNFFGSLHQSGSITKRYVFDITEIMLAAIADNSWPSEPTVTIVPRGSLGVKSATIESIDFLINRR